uniref:Uncharacterized protein n=1 Tax=Tetraodon nigroviridis TaxID=99883 RepID=H3C415_TETNG
MAAPRWRLRGHRRGFPPLGSPSTKPSSFPLKRSLRGTPGPFSSWFVPAEAPAELQVPDRAAFLAGSRIHVSAARSSAPSPPLPSRGGCFPLLNSKPPSWPPKRPASSRLQPPCPRQRKLRAACRRRTRLQRPGKRLRAAAAAATEPGCS